MFIKKHHIGITAIMVLTLFILQLTPALARTSTTSSKSQPSTTSSISVSIDATEVAAAKAALAKAAILNPVEGTDTNVTAMAQTIVNAVSSGVVVTVYNSSNTAVSKSGAITYSSLLKKGNFTFKLTKNRATATQSMSVVVPAHIVIDPDATQVAAAKAALTKASTLNPVEGTDTNVVPLAQTIVDAASSGVVVTITASNNAQVAADGTITYGSLAVNGKVTFTLTKNKAADTQSMSVDIPAKIATDTDATEVAAAKAALAKAATLNPVEGKDTSVVTMAQAIVDGASYGVAVTISSSANSQVAADGTITYGSLAVNGKVTFTLTKNLATATQSMSIAVPALALNEQCANIKDFGAKGDGTTDDTLAFKAAIATGLPVYVPSTDKCYIISDSLYLQNSISFADHAKLQFKVDFSIKYECYRWKNILVVKNKINENTLYINNPQIDGGWAYAGCALNWGDPGFYTGDNGHAISIISSTNVKVEGGNLTNLGGDGIFLSNDASVSQTAENYSPENINIEGTVIENPNRCILGIEAAKNCSFTNVTGYKHNNYVAAIDIEPNTLRPNATIDNLLFDTCNIISDGSYLSDSPIAQYGLSFPGKAPSFKTDCVSTAGHNWGDITVNNSTFKATNCYATSCTGTSNLDYFTNNLTFNGCEFDSNYGAFTLWGKDSITVKDCVVNLTADAHQSSSILSMADGSGLYNCVATIDNLQYNCLGDSQLFIYQMGKAEVTRSNIVINSINPSAKDIYSALYFRNCQSFTVQNCLLSSMRNALMFTGNNQYFYIDKNTLVPHDAEDPYHYCVLARPTGTINYSMSGNVYNTSSTGTGKILIDGTLPYLKGDLATTV